MLVVTKPIRLPLVDDAADFVGVLPPTTHRLQRGDRVFLHHLANHNGNAHNDDDNDDDRRYEMTVVKPMRSIDPHVRVERPTGVLLLVVGGDPHITSEHFRPASPQGVERVFEKQRFFSSP